MAGWNAKLAKLAAKVATQGKAGKIKRTPRELYDVLRNKPEDYSETYQAAIDMFSMHSEPTIDILSKDFDRLVRNNWEWTEEWRATNMLYSRR
jgi:hypothetical protein